MILIGMIIGVGGGYMVWRTGEMIRNLQRADRKHKHYIDDFSIRIRQLEKKTKTIPTANPGPPYE